MSLNISKEPSKSNYMVFGNKKSNIGIEQVQLNRISLDRVAFTKFIINKKFGNFLHQSINLL